MARGKGSTAKNGAGSAGDVSVFSKKSDIDAQLDALFSSSLGPLAQPNPKISRGPSAASRSSGKLVPAARETHVPEAAADDLSDGSTDSDQDSVIEKSSGGDLLLDGEGNGDEGTSEDRLGRFQGVDKGHEEGGRSQGRRKRKHEDEDLEDRYMERLAQEEKSEAARLAKRQKASEDPVEDIVARPAAIEDAAESTSPPPQHETVSGDLLDVDKASRTVFLGNVSTDAILTKAARKILLSHLSSHLDSLAAGKGPHRVESLRFRSTAYGNSVPKRAAYAKKDVMGATTKSTNAYAVYTTKDAARDAATHLNGTIVLGRHLRVDEVAHPSKTDHRRCVFVGNLGFVDDERQMQDNAEGADAEKRKKKDKEPADVEEGLWREFSKIDTLESVRVVRDAKTRVGKGFAYVQFRDENAVEAALLLNDKKIPPMLPRKLRVMRAKAVKRNSAKSTAPPARAARPGTYNPKVSAEQQSLQGRAGKLFGKAGAAHVHGKVKSSRPQQHRADAIKPPEAFIFEGHRATSSQKPKIKVKSAKGGKPQTRSSRRGTAWKAKTSKSK